MKDRFATTSKRLLWAGYLVSTVPVMLLLTSAAMKFLKPAGFAEGIEHLGWTDGQVLAVGVLEIICTLIYVFPRTAVLGAILLTGYLGGATATHVRVGDPFFATVILGVLVWLGLFLRDGRIRELIPLRS